MFNQRLNHLVQVYFASFKQYTYLSKYSTTASTNYPLVLENIVFLLQLQKQVKGKLKQYENKLSWRHGLSHLLRRSKSSSSTNNNVSVLRGKHSNSNSTTGNGTTGNSVSNKRPSGGERESYLTGETDANKINPPSAPAHKCSKSCLQLYISKLSLISFKTSYPGLFSGRQFEKTFLFL